jgi:hypothetical protein
LEADALEQKTIDVAIEKEKERVRNEAFLEEQEEIKK